MTVLISGSTSTATTKRAPSDSSSPISFHLQTGLAAFCSFILIIYAFLFHILRAWKEEPPREGGEDISDLDEKMKNSWIRRRIIGKTDANGFKRFAYRVSRLFTGVNVVLLLCVCVSAGLQAASGGFNTGFICESSLSGRRSRLMAVLIIAWILLLLVAVLEFMDEGRKIKRWLMVRKGARIPCWPGHSGRKRKAAQDDEEMNI